VTFREECDSAPTATTMDSVLGRRHIRVVSGDKHEIMMQSRRGEQTVDQWHRLAVAGGNGGQCAPSFRDCFTDRQDPVLKVGAQIDFEPGLQCPRRHPKLSLSIPFLTSPIVRTLRNRMEPIRFVRPAGDVAIGFGLDESVPGRAGDPDRYVNRGEAMTAKNSAKLAWGSTTLGKPSVFLGGSNDYSLLAVFCYELATAFAAR